jgi:hypothetical protein
VDKEEGLSRDWGNVNGSDMIRRALAGWETWMGLVGQLIETRTDSRTRSVDLLEISQALPASKGPAGHIAPVHIPPISGQSPVRLDTPLSPSNGQGAAGAFSPARAARGSGGGLPPLSRIFGRVRP